MFNKINVSQICSNHFASLVNDNTKKAATDDYATFLVVPAIVATVLIYFQITLGKEVISLIVAALSIFVGLLFNVIVLIFDIINRNPKKKIKNEFLRQILANISFTILLSVVTIVICFVALADHRYIINVSNWIVYFLLVLFLTTILMILKRMYVLFANEIDEIEQNSNNGN